MAITKTQKSELVDLYIKDLGEAKNVVIIKQSGITVNAASKLRIELEAAGGKMTVIRKRLFLRSLTEAKYQDVGIGDLEGSVVAMYSLSDEYAPLKAINNAIKQWKKEKSPYTVEYVGGWYEKNWKNASYVGELANLPTKEELIGKLLFLLKHPVQKLTGTLDAIAKKKQEA